MPAIIPDEGGVSLVFDIILESLRALVLLALVGFILGADDARFQMARPGWRLIVVGFALLLFGSLLDITDNFESLNGYVVIGDTETEAFLEKVIGFLGGFLLIGIGLYRWIPAVHELSREIETRKQAEKDLQSSEALLVEAQRISHVGSWDWDVVNDNQFWSEEMCRIWGIEGSQGLVSYEEFFSRIHPDDQEGAQLAIDDAIRGDQEFRIEYRLVIPGEEERIISTRGEVYRDKDGNPIRMMGATQDITQLKKLIEDRGRFDTLAANAPVGIFYSGPDGIAQYVNKALASIAGYPVEAMVDELWHSKIYPEDRDAITERWLENVNSGKPWLAEFRFQKPDGTVAWVLGNTNPQFDEEGKVVSHVGTIIDITTRKLAEIELNKAHYELEKSRDSLEHIVESRTQELAATVKQLQNEILEREKVQAELKFLANHDALTGLPSLRLCKDRLEMSIAVARRNNQGVLVMFLDLDGFKQVNDNHGHDCGDTVLKVTADRISARVRETDTTARIGGDEFLVILSNFTDLEIVERIANNIISDISQEILIEQNAINIGVSIGIAVYPKDGKTSAELIRQADTAMYRIKRAGKNNFGFVNQTTKQTLRISV